jgi:hypothetical protein
MVKDFETSSKWQGFLLCHPEFISGSLANMPH